MLSSERRQSGRRVNWLWLVYQCPYGIFELLDGCSTWPLALPSLDGAEVGAGQTCTSTELSQTPAELCATLPQPFTQANFIC